MWRRNPVEGETREGEEKGGQPTPPPASLLPVGREEARGRELLSSDDSSDGATKGYGGFGFHTIQRGRARKLLREVNTA
jgi:hypothetical protein